MRKTQSTEKMVEHTLDEFKALIPIFSVLADENRQKIIMALGRYDRLNVKEIHEMIPLSRPAISHHLKNLKQSGLIDNDKKGTENYYFLTINEAVESVRALMDRIEETCQLL